MLVEPPPQAYAQCTVNRPNSSVFNCALTDSGVAQITADLDGNPMASVHGQRLQRAAQVTVRAASLTQIFDAALKEKPVDPMSIDVENYELNVLRSLDYSIYRPRHILAEVYTPSFLMWLTTCWRKNTACCATSPISTNATILIGTAATTTTS